MTDQKMDLSEMLTMAPVEIVCTVANVFVPGLGSVVNALVVVGKLCMEMKENQQVCTRVEKRFGEIFTQLQLMEKKGTLPKNDAVSRYAELLEKFYRFLKKQHKKNVILRLAAAKGVLYKIQEFHDEMDQLFKMLNLAHMDATTSWQQQSEKDRLQQQQQLELVAGNIGLILKELSTNKAQAEALTLLKFEVERSPDTEQNSKEVVLLKSAFKKVVSVSKVEVEKIPGWFLPPDDVDYDDEPFSRGSFGTVHRGIWGVGTDVVVKCLIDDASSNERAKESFLKECNVWYGMNHPHVIKMFGACHVTSPPFIVCEYADNGSLDSFLFRKSTTRATVWKMLYQTCLGLEYLHSRAIVHGDLKCNNVLVAGDSAKLADFGFSFIRLRASLMSVKPQTGATRWKAPELLMGETPSLSSDIYAFGMCIIEAVTGDAPWGMVDDDTVRHLVKEGRLPPRPKEMDKNVWLLIQQMCAKDPGHRIKLKVVAGQLNKIYQAEQERDIEARLESAAIQDAPNGVKCVECQFVMGRGATFCSRCGYNIRDSKPNNRSSSNSSSSASNPSQAAPLESVESQAERLVCENCFATAPAGSAQCPECSSSMASDDLSTPLKLSKEQLLAIFDSVYTKMGQTMTRLRELSQKDPLMAAAERGPQLVEQFEEALESTQSTIYAAFRTTCEDVRITTDFYRGREDRDVLSVVARLEELQRVKTIGFVNEDEIPADLTLQKCAEITRESMEMLNVAVEEEYAKVKDLIIETGETDQDKIEEIFNERANKRVRAIALELHIKYGYTNETRHAAIRKYRKDPGFEALFAELKQHQSVRFAAAKALFEGN